MIRFSRTSQGIVAIAILLLAAVAVFYKEEIGTRFIGLVTPVEKIKAEFPRAYKLREYRAGSAVKMAGVVVGTITDIAQTDRGSSMVTMQLDHGTREKLGAAPRAVIRATLIVGGRYYVDLIPGGAGAFVGDLIPPERTQLPTELEGVLEASGGTELAKKGIRSSIHQFDGFLQQGGIDALHDVVTHAPDTLRPSGDVLAAMRGTRPDQDLTEMVTNLRSTAAGLDSRDGQIESIIGAVEGSTRALAAGSKPLAASIADMPGTLRATKAGLDDLNPTLDQLVVTAGNFRPAARALDPMLEELDPALANARPLLGDLRSLLRDARPLVEHLVPVTRGATEVSDNVGGSVLDRVNGPIADAVLSPWKGQGPYAGGGASGNPLYVEAGHLASRSAQVFGWHDKNGGFTRLSAGVGLNTLGGSAGQLSLEQYLEHLGMQQPAGPQAFAGRTGPLPSGPGTQTGPVRPALPQAPLVGPSDSGKSPLLLPLSPGGGGSR